VKAVCWTGVNEVETLEVPDPGIYNRKDMIIKVRYSSVCGSDLHQLSGYIPAMQSGDVIGHEFMGEVIEVGPEVEKHHIGDRVVVCSFISCGGCYFCRNGLHSACDNTNTNPAITEAMWGYAPGGIFGYSHAMGGYKGSHAEYVRVPFADNTAFTIPDEVDDLTALFASDSAPTGYMAAHMGGVQPGDVVAVWGCGAVGQMAARSAMILGAQRVIAIDRFRYRMEAMEREIGAETIDYENQNVDAELRERTGGRGPDVCIEAVGMECHSPHWNYRIEQAKQQTRVLQTDRGHTLREMIICCRKGGSIFVAGVFAGFVDHVPMGAFMNKGLRMASAQQPGERYIPELLERMARGELKTKHLATHPMTLDQGARGYDLFKNKKEGCIRAVFTPDGNGTAAPG
jgi:threonine dehydrogenase-like Zn-dependent dehydrogenase